MDDKEIGVVILLFFSFFFFFPSLPFSRAGFQNRKRMRPSFYPLFPFPPLIWPDKNGTKIFFFLPSPPKN